MFVLLNASLSISCSKVTWIFQYFQGFGQLLYMELKKRLQSVGIRTILCWGDKESEGFWIKQVMHDWNISYLVDVIILVCIFNVNKNIFCK